MTFKFQPSLVCPGVLFTFFFYILVKNADLVSNMGRFCSYRVFDKSQMYLISAEVEKT